MVSGCEKSSRGKAQSATQTIGRGRTCDPTGGLHEEEERAESTHVLPHLRVCVRGQVTDDLKPGANSIVSQRVP